MVAGAGFEPAMRDYETLDLTRLVDPAAHNLIRFIT